MSLLFYIPVAAMCAVTGMWYEYHTGVFEHWARRITQPRFPTPQPVLHDDYIDDCEHFNRALLRASFGHRALEAPDTIQ